MVDVTMESVARAAGVSRSLVSLAYRRQPGVSEATRQHILAVGERLHYTPNQMASRLAGRGGNTLGVFMQDLRNDLFADIYDGLREIADVERKYLVLSIGTIDGQRDSTSLSALLQSRVDVIIAVGLQMPDTEVLRLGDRVPIVSVAREIAGIDTVTSDNAIGARIATEHLLRLGHRDIVFLANPPTDGYLDRRRGYVEAIRSAGLKPRIMETSYARGEAAVDAGVLLDGGDPPSAFFAHNDQTALGVLDALAMRNIAAGREVSVVGYDNTSASRSPGTELTTVDIDGQNLGRNAALMALRRLDAPGRPGELHMSVPSLVIRSTTGRRSTTR